MVFETIKDNNLDIKFTPYNFYFELDNNKDINDVLIKKELIVFLSLFN
jgi:hypothetical protein